MLLIFHHFWWADLKTSTLVVSVVKGSSSLLWPLVTEVDKTGVYQLLMCCLQQC